MQKFAECGSAFGAGTSTAFACMVVFSHPMLEGGAWGNGAVLGIRSTCPIQVQEMRYITEVFSAEQPYAEGHGRCCPSCPP